MRFAVIIRENGTEYSLIKTSDEDRANAVAVLSQLHMKKLRPDAHISLSVNRSLNRAIEMHPQRDEIIDGLRALEFPLPVREYVIEGEYRRL